MLLAIDVGNSTVGFGLFDGDNLASAFSAETRPGATADEYRHFLSSQMELEGLEPGAIDDVVISCVVPQMVRVFFKAVGSLTDKSPLLVSHRLELGIKVAYKTPETLGADRLASASAAYAEGGGPVVVVDFGTATTFSAVDGDGTFVGGAIAPGLLTGYEALTRAAAGLPRVGLAFPKDAIGKATGEGLQSGLIFGHAAMVDGMLARFRKEFGEARVVATGGLADMVVPHMGTKASTEPYLTLKGLSAISRFN